MKIQRWLAHEKACAPATRFIEQHGWWRACYDVPTDRDDWWRWLLMKLSREARAKRLIHRQLRTENDRLIKEFGRTRRLSGEAVERLRKKPRWLPTRHFGYNTLEDTLRFMQGCARPDGPRDHSIYSWWIERTTKPVYTEVMTSETRVRLYRELYPREVLERLLSFNQIE